MFINACHTRMYIPRVYYRDNPDVTSPLPPICAVINLNSWYAGRSNGKFYPL